MLNHLIIISSVLSSTLSIKIVKSLKDYKYSSYHQFFNNIPDFLQNSWIVDNYILGVRQ